MTVPAMKREREVRYAGRRPTMKANSTKTGCDSVMVRRKLMPKVKLSATDASRSAAMV
jgi:hypothetical protein